MCGSRLLDRKAEPQSRRGAPRGPSSAARAPPRSVAPRGLGALLLFFLLLHLVHLVLVHLVHLVRLLLLGGRLLFALLLHLVLVHLVHLALLLFLGGGSLGERLRDRETDTERERDAGNQSHQLLPSASAPFDFELDLHKHP